MVSSHNRANSADGAGQYTQPTGRIPASLVAIGPNLVEIGPEFVEIGQKLVHFGQSGRNPPKPGQSRGPNLPKAVPSVEFVPALVDIVFGLPRPRRFSFQQLWLHQIDQ